MIDADESLEIERRRFAAYPRSAGNVDEFELDAVRIGKEDSVVTCHIL